MVRRTETWTEPNLSLSLTVYKNVIDQFQNCAPLDLHMSAILAQDILSQSLCLSHKCSDLQDENWKLPFL